MPVFKKRKYAPGGAIQKSFNNPGFGLGLEYIPTAQELPDLEGLMYVEQAKNQARTQLEALRKESVPDVSEIVKGLDELEMFGSVKQDFKREIQSDVARYMARMKADPDYAFSMEARNEYRNLLNKLNSSNYEYQALRYKELEKDFSNSMQKGLGEEMYVSNGMIPVVDLQKRGSIKMMPISEAQKLFNDPETSERFTTFNKSSQIWDYYHKYTDRNFNNYLNFSGRSTVRDAKKEVEDVFKNVAFSMMDDVSYDDIANKSGIAVYQQFREKTKSNKSQLDAAVRQVMRNLSQGSLDAMRGDYIQRTGDLSDQGFSNYVMDYLSGEQNIRTETSHTIDSDVDILSNELQNRVNGSGNNLGKPIPGPKMINLRDSNFFPDLGAVDAFNAPVIAKSSTPARPLDVVAQRTFHGPKMVFSGKSGSTGAGLSMQNNDQTLHYVTHRGDYLLPFSTGEVITVRDGKRVVEKDTGLVEAGKLLGMQEGENIYRSGRLKIKDGSQQEFEINGRKYLAYQSSEDPEKFIVAAPKAMGIYHGFPNEDRKEKEATVLMQAMDPTQATQSFGNPAWSMEYEYSDFYDSRTNELKSSGKELFGSFIQSIDSNIENINGALSVEVSKMNSERLNKEKLLLNDRKTELTAMFEYLDKVSKGDIILNSQAEKDSYERLRFNFNMLLNELERNNTVETINDITTVINNSFRATTTFNNLIR